MDDSVIEGGVLLHRPERAMSASAAEQPQERLRRLVEEYFDVVFRAARRFGTPPSLVDDCTQQVFVVAASKLESISVESERAFLLGTTFRQAKAFRRRVQDVPPEADSEDAVLAGADSVPDLDEIVDRKRARLVLDDLLAEMPEDLRAVFVLYEIEGITVSEIAHVLELAPGTAASRLRRAREDFTRGVERHQAKQRFRNEQAHGRPERAPGSTRVPEPAPGSGRKP